MSRRVTVDADRLQRWLEGFEQRHEGATATADDTSLRLVGADGDVATITVPFPPWRSGTDPVSALVAHVTRRRRVAVILVRRGGHAIGVFDGSELISSKVDSSYVQGTTKAGGWSQQRFARRRANQASAAFAHAADHAVRVLTPYRDSIEALVAGGDRQAVDAVLADPRLEWIRARRSGPLLAVPDPRLKVLRATPGQFRAVTVEVDP